ncbi:hypothetical protein [uncultured Mediterranean phage uvMED]|nr:hypothetical protein [uncultured Mediterranean phage uvMED]
MEQEIGKLLQEYENQYPNDNIDFILRFTDDEILSALKNRNKRKITIEYQKDEIGGGKIIYL